MSKNHPSIASTFQIWIL